MDESEKISTSSSVCDMIRLTSAEDKSTILNILKETSIFKQEEIRIADELIDTFLSSPENPDYQFYSWVDSSDSVSGFLCFGTTHIAKGTYDLYWLVVSPRSQGKGVGRDMLLFVEDKVRQERGRLIIVETSSTDDYNTARRFYRKNGFDQVGNIKDYYVPGDDLVIYAKYL